MIFSKTQLCRFYSSENSDLIDFSAARKACIRSDIDVKEKKKLGTDAFTITQFIVGWSIPVPNHTPFVTLFIHTIQMAYPVISNATQLHDFLQEGIAKGVRYTKRGVFFLLERFLSR